MRRRSWGQRQRDTGTDSTWGLGSNPAPPMTSGVALGKLFNLSICKNEGYTTTNIIRNVKIIIQILLLITADSVIVRIK